MRPDLRRDPFLILLHGPQQLVARGAAGEFVGVGHQRALFRHGLHIARQDVVPVQPVDDLLARQPLRDRDRMKDLLARHERIDHVAQAGTLLEQIFARP